MNILRSAHAEQFIWQITSVTTQGHTATKTSGWLAEVGGEPLRKVAMIRSTDQEVFWTSTSPTVLSLIILVEATLGDQSLRNIL